MEDSDLPPRHRAWIGAPEKPERQVVMGFASSLWMFTAIIGCLMTLVVCGMYLCVQRKRQRNSFSPFTEDTLRLPGHSLQVQLTRKHDDVNEKFMWLCLSSVGLAVCVVLEPSRIRVILCVVVLAFAVLLVLRMWRFFGELTNLRLGYEGEAYTGQELSLLMCRGAFVFHDIPYRYGNIDHIVIGGDTVFAVETKAYRKPVTADRCGKNARVVFDGKTLRFPTFSSDKPLKQAQLHAQHIRSAIRKHCGFEFKVIAVVALPGWYVQVENSAEGVMVINPKRGKVLASLLGDVANKSQRDVVTRFIESIARSAGRKSDLFDPDATRKYDVWLNPHPKDASLD